MPQKGWRESKWNLVRPSEGTHLGRRKPLTVHCDGSSNQLWMQVIVTGLVLYRCPIFETSLVLIQNCALVMISTARESVSLLAWEDGL